MNDAAAKLWPIDRSMHELLIVDDDPASRYVTTRLLKAAGFRVREAATGADGLDLADDSISAMVLDVHLPDIDGFELCRRLRMRSDATARLPVLHLTAAFVTDDDKVRGLDSGADAYLTHPVEPAVLVATVQALVRTHVAEGAMRRSEEKFRAIYAQAPSGISLLDATGRFSDANPALLALLGRDLADILGKRVSSFVPLEWVERVDAYTAHVPDGPRHHEFPVLATDGRTVHLEWAISSHVEPSLTMAVATDISQRVLLEQQRLALLERERVARSSAERLNTMKDEFIAVLSHELRTPLNAIMGWTNVLQRRMSSDEAAVRGLGAIERNGKMQARLIADLLDMSSMNMGKLPLRRELTDPRVVVEEAVSSMRPAIEEKGITLVLALTPPYRSIWIDRARVDQVVWNLLSNAVKFSAKGGEIVVILREANEGLNLCVKDQGLGIAPDFLPFLFDRFTQSDATRKRHSGGLGLGLSIVKHIVEAHGGTVRALSDGLGRGAQFEVWLPTANQDIGPSVNPLNAPPETLRDPARHEEALEGLHLLVVDDDPEARAMLEVILRERGAVVTLAGDYEKALLAISVSVPDVLISDVGMPAKDGYDLIQEIRTREAGQHRMPAIALTSFTRDQDKEQALSSGFDAHLPKPLDPERLVRLIKVLSGRARDSESHWAPL